MGSRAGELCKLMEPHVQLIKRKWAYRFTIHVQSHGFVFANVLLMTVKITSK